jgi:hypothetical protein
VVRCITRAAAEVPLRIGARREIALDHLAQEVGGFGWFVGLGRR